MSGKCPKCEALVTVVVESVRVRDEASEKTWPAVLFLCGQCRCVLSVSSDPEWQAQIVAGQLRSVGPTQA